jgi:hypothetical protein
MAEYISKQRTKDLMGCCLASAKANYKEETDVFKRAKFQCYVETIEAMIDVVGAVEAVDVQPVKKCKMIPQKTDCRGYTDVFLCTNCQLHIHLGFISKNYGGNFCLECGAEVEDGEQNDT